MRRAIAVPVLVAVLCGGSSAALALGFGPVSNASRLGQPLDLSVALKIDSSESLSPDCVLAEVSAGDNRIAPAQVRTQLVRQGSSQAAVARIRTTSRINEPVVTVVLSLGCPPKAAHKFVSLLDPPRTAATTAPLSHAVAARADAPAAAGASQVVGAPASSVSSPLTLEPHGVQAVAEVELQARERERTTVLEERLDRLNREHRATAQAVAALQGRLREAEAARRSDPAIYGLVTLVVLLLVAIGALLWRLARTQGDRALFAYAKSLAGDLQADPDPTLASRGIPVDDETLTSMRLVSEPLGKSLPPEEVTTAVDDTPRTNVLTATRLRSGLSSEELIDLEQQADFFVALGDEESAIDLLMKHVRSSGGTSPMPYLKLLEIYRRRSDSEAYARICERFNRRFNAHAPEWEVDPNLQCRELSSYTAVVQRLQSAWPTPSKSIGVLEALLFRRDSTDEMFDLPAYEELLFLYAVNRDILEHDPSPDGVDLLLPLSTDEEVSAIMRPEVTLPPPRRRDARPVVGLRAGE
jgi:hypothetical protein